MWRFGPADIFGAPRARRSTALISHGWSPAPPRADRIRAARRPARCGTMWGGTRWGVWGIARRLAHIVQIVMSMRNRLTRYIKYETCPGAENATRRTRRPRGLVSRQTLPNESMHVPRPHTGVAEPRVTLVTRVRLTPPPVIHDSTRSRRLTLDRPRHRRHAGIDAVPLT